MNRLFILLLLTLTAAMPVYSKGQTTRTERKCILQGNDLYRQQKYGEAIKSYEAALKDNPASAEASYNIGLAYLQLAAGKNVDEKNREKYMKEGIERMDAATKHSATKPALASRANYNLGNIAFNKEEYEQALQLYKQALRLNPNDEDARRNLRITQLKMQQNQQNKNDDKNKDQNKDKDKDKDKDKNKNQNQDQNKNQNQDKNDNKNDNKDTQQQNQERMNPDAAKQILQAVENKENMTRNRMINAGKNGKQNAARGRRNGKNW